MKESIVRRSREGMIGSALAVAGATGLPLVAGAVGLSSPVGSCSQVGSNSRVICFSATAFPTGAPSTGAGDASHSSDANLLASGGIALAAAAGAMGLAMSRRSRRNPTE